MHTPHNIIEDTHAKMLVSTLEHQVSWGDADTAVVDHNVTYHTPQSRVNDTFTHVTLNIMNRVVVSCFNLRWLKKGSAMNLSQYY